MRAYVVVHVTPQVGADAVDGEDWRFLKDSVSQYKRKAPPVTRNVDAARVFPLERACFEAGVIVGRGGWASIRVVDDDLEFFSTWEDVAPLLRVVK